MLQLQEYPFGAVHKVRGGNDSFKRGWLPRRGKAQMACNLMLPHEDNIVNIIFIIWKERHNIRTSCLVGLKPHPTISAPVGVRTDDLPPHSVNKQRCPTTHSAMAAASRASPQPIPETAILWTRSIVVQFVSHVTLALRAAHGDLLNLSRIFTSCAFTALRHFGNRK